MLLDSRAAGYSGGQNMVVLIIRFAVAIGSINAIVQYSNISFLRVLQEVRYFTQRYVNGTRLPENTTS